MLKNLLDVRQRMVPGYSFLVTIGDSKFSFSKVTNLVSQIEYETVVEGGNNDYPYLFPKPKTKPDTLILEKGVKARSLDCAFNQLVEGMQVEMVTILLLKNLLELEKAFYFKSGLIIRRKFSDLNAMGNELLIETLEIAHTGLVEIPITEV